MPDDEVTRRLLHAQGLFDLSAFAHRAIFEGTAFAWDALPHIEAYILHQGAGSRTPDNQADVHPAAVIEGAVSIGGGTRVEPGAYIRGPVIIGAGCQIRQGAYIRGNVILGDRCVVGHATELKNSILLDDAQAPHFAYVGDSVVGNRVNLGAGTRLANFPLQGTPAEHGTRRPSIRLLIDGIDIDTRVGKLGAILGDDVQMGCNVVTSPGCIIGPRTVVYPLVALKKGFYRPDRIIKLRQHIEDVARE